MPKPVAKLNKTKASRMRSPPYGRPAVKPGRVDGGWACVDRSGWVVRSWQSSPGSPERPGESPHGGAPDNTESEAGPCWTNFST